MKKETEYFKPIPTPEPLNPEIKVISYNDSYNFNKAVNAALADRWRIRGDLQLGSGDVVSNRYNILLEREVLK